jgi:integrase
MARLPKSSKISTRSGRATLAVRRDPYWVPVTQGCFLGYRKGLKGGTWRARWRAADGTQRWQSLGPADDLMDAVPGGNVLTFADAYRAATAWFKIAESNDRSQGASDDEDGLAVHSGPSTVGMAMESYVRAYARSKRRRVRGGGDAADKMRAVIAHTILPDLGEIPLDRLTTKRIDDWHEALAARPRHFRGGHIRKGAMDDEVRRMRESSANRTLTILKAALNHAYRSGKTSDPNAWKRVQPFHNVEKPRTRFLSDDEVQRLVNSADPGFRPLIQAALFTGCRYGEIVRLKVSDVRDGSVFIATSKSGKPRTVQLTDEGALFFKRAIAGRRGNDLVFVRTDGNAWGASHQSRPFRGAAGRAKLGADVVFHVLRHAYASKLVQRGVSLMTVAAQLGHADTRMVERVYGHLQPSHIRDAVQVAMGDLGILRDDNVEPLKVAV